MVKTSTFFIIAGILLIAGIGADSLPGLTALATILFTGSAVAFFLWLALAVMRHMM
jgi:hypothetical protein